MRTKLQNFGMSLPLLTGGLAICVAGAAVWLQMQVWVDAHPLWIRATDLLPAGSTPFGVLSKVAGVLGLITIGVVAFRGAQEEDRETAPRVALYGQSDAKSPQPAVKPRRPVDFHAMAKARAGEPVGPRAPFAPKRSFRGLRAAAAMAVVAMIVLVGLPMISDGAAVAGADEPATSAIVGSVTATVGPAWTHATTYVANFDHEEAIADARTIVQGAMSGQLDPQVRIGVALLTTVWLAMMIRAMSKLLFGRRRKGRANLTHLQYN